MFFCSFKPCFFALLSRMFFCSCIFKPRVCGTAGTLLTFRTAGPAPDSIIGILIFKYPPTTALPLIQLNFFPPHFAPGEGGEAKIFCSFESSNVKQGGASMSVSLFEVALNMVGNFPMENLTRMLSIVSGVISFSL